MGNIKSKWALSFGSLGFRFYCWRNNLSLRLTAAQQAETERLADRLGWRGKKEPK